MKANGLEVSHESRDSKFVLAIESEAKALEGKVRGTIIPNDAATDQRVNEAKSNMEHSLEVYKAELKEKNQQKKAEFEAKVKDELAKLLR